MKLTLRDVTQREMLVLKSLHLVSWTLNPLSVTIQVRSIEELLVLPQCKLRDTYALAIDNQVDTIVVS